jgi:hypothetical protein
VTGRLDLDDLHAGLRAALRKGARAPQLAAHTPGLVDLLCPAGGRDSAATLQARALAAETLLIEASRKLGEREGTAVRIMLCLTAESRHTGVMWRRAQAAALYGVCAETFRQARQDVFLADLAVEVYRLREAGTSDGR